MKKNGFTLVELLAVIVVLGIVMVLATTTVLPLMSQSREKAFRTEANGVLQAAETVRDLYTLGELTMPTNSCELGTKMCFTIDDLIDSGYYKGDKDTYDGTLTIDLSSNDYTLNFKKGSEFAIIGGTVKDYVKNTTGTAALDQVSTWADANETCSCS